MIAGTVYMTTSRRNYGANSPVRQPYSGPLFRILEDSPHKQGVARHYQRSLSRGSKLGAEMAFEAQTAHPTLCGFCDVTLPYEAEVREVGFRTSNQQHAVMLHFMGAERKNNIIPLIARLYVISANEGSITPLWCSEFDAE